MQPVDALLADLADALHRADFAALTVISARLETVSLPDSPAALRRTAQLAQHNQAAIAAAASGLRAAHRRVAALRSGHTLTTYDGAGHKTDRPAGPARLQRI